MKKGIGYVQGTSVSGLIKLCQTGENYYQDRMRFFEADCGCNLFEIKRFFSIELEDYVAKESRLINRRWRNNESNNYSKKKWRGY